MHEKSATPVCILGAAHSGTTILLRMLGLHPATCWFSQYSQRNGTIPGYCRLPGHTVINRALRAVLPHSWKKGRQSIRSTLLPQPYEGYSIWNYVFPLHTDVSVEESSKRLRQIVESEMRSWHRSTLLLKMPRLSRHLDTIHKTLPEAKYIHIVRDGAALALSCQHKFEQNGESPPEALKKSIGYWEELTTAVHDRQDVLNVHEMRYEDFCEDTHAHLRTLMDYIGINPEQFPFHRIPKMLTCTNSKWFAAIDTNRWQLLEELRERYPHYVSLPEKTA